MKAPYLLTSPRACAVALSAVLAALPAHIRIQRMTVTACLAVSSRGREAVAELARQTAELLNARALESRLFDRQMAFNLLAQVEQTDAEGHSALERQIADDIKQLMVLPDLPVAVTCIQTPIFLATA